MSAFPGTPARYGVRFDSKRMERQDRGHVEVVAMHSRGTRSPMADDFLFNRREMTMAEDQTEAGGTTSTTIDVNDDASVHAWAKKLDATPEQIREAVAAKGNQAPDVEMHLKGSHATTNADQEARAESAKDSR